MDIQLDGSSRLYFIVGDPIAQVKSPEGVTASFQAHGLNALCVPAHVKSADFAGFIDGMHAVQNVDGIIVTVPHKIQAASLCASLSDAARFLNTANTLRRTDQGWHGDMFDGQAQVAALQKNGAALAGKKALLGGTGGAGTAIAFSLVEAGVRELALYDIDSARRDALIARLNALGKAHVYASSRRPEGFDVVVNATPLGMKAGDALPFDVEFLRPGMVVGDVVTQPALTPWIAAAQRAGCVTSTGLDMFASVRDLMVNFLLQTSVQAA